MMQAHELQQRRQGARHGIRYGLRVDGGILDWLEQVPETKQVRIPAHHHSTQKKSRNRGNGYAQWSSDRSQCSE